MYWKVNTPRRVEFMVFELDGITPKQGLLDGAFSKFVSRNGTVVGLTVTVSEVDNTLFPGLYAMVYTPNVNSIPWTVKVTHATYLKRGTIDRVWTRTLDPDDVASAILATPSQKIVTDGAGRVTVGTLAANVIDASCFAAETARKIADHVLRRDYAAARVSADGDTLTFRSLLGGVAKLVNKIKVEVGDQLIIRHEDGVTAFGVQTIETVPGADPITALSTV